MGKEQLREGDYVLATKYPDGDPGDHFAIGYYKGPLVAGGYAHNRHIVVDESSRSFRAAGFRRAQRITAERGKWLLQRLPEIEQSNQ